jgi:hypothetical protein
VHYLDDKVYPLSKVKTQRDVVRKLLWRGKVSARGTELAGQWAWQLGVNEEANRYALHAPDAQGEITLEELRSGEERSS